MDDRRDEYAVVDAGRMPPATDPPAPPAKRQAVADASTFATSRPGDIDAQPPTPANVVVTTSGPTLEDVLRALPAHLAERIRVLKPSRPSSSAAAPSPGGDTAAPVAVAPETFVLYWMRNAMRATENPSLCVAVSAANAMNLPLLVLITVEERHHHATARRHTFILQGAAEVIHELRERRIHAALHVERKNNRSPAHLTLAHRAALVVTDEPFTEPWLTPCRKLVSGTFKAPVWAVDAACIVPARLVPRGSCGRAFAFAAATEKLRRRDRSKMPYVDVQYEYHRAAATATSSDDTGVLESGAHRSSPAETMTATFRLPFEQVEIPAGPAEATDAAIADIVSGLEIDQDVAPVSHTTRGGTSAAVDRWSAWVERGGLKEYARRRNNALQVHGVSRMSPYLNLGMMSPFRMTRDALAAAGAGATRFGGGWGNKKNNNDNKFLDEFHTWRELSYAHCFHNPDVHLTLEGLPKWAQTTLRAHAGDPRARVFTLETLAKGETGFHLWDAMQDCLTRRGELHNNARMTWGKQILGWCATPEEACERLLWLNDHFALDGQSPPSVGGLMWCLGLFDGPKTPEKPIHGTVRTKALSSYKYDSAQFRAGLGLAPKAFMAAGGGG